MIGAVYSVMGIVRRSVEETRHMRQIPATAFTS